MNPIYGLEEEVWRMKEERKRREAMALRDELIQVAAVAIAFVQDIDHGTTELFGTTAWDYVFTDVRVERYRQEDKWGPQHHSPFEWLSILAEEVGEAAQAANDAHDWVDSP